jgi:DNA repair photolyase
MFEKRKCARSKSTFPVEITTADGVVNGETVDVGKLGARLVANQPLVNPSTIEIQLPPCYSEDPHRAAGIQTDVEVIWDRTTTARNKYFYGVRFLNIRTTHRNLLAEIVDFEREKAGRGVQVEQPKIDIHRVPQSCNMLGVDLTVGCESMCRYCHFSIPEKNSLGHREQLSSAQAIPVDISPMYELAELPQSVVYLSPASDPFAPAARERTHQLLDYMLPKGVTFTLCTKQIVPIETMRLLEKYRRQIEGVGVSVTSLDEERNRVLESGCPTGKRRVEHIRELVETGCFVGGRMDPLFPLVDDTDENLKEMIAAIARAGAGHVVGTYLFTYGNYRKQLKQIPVCVNAFETAVTRIL